MKNKTLATWLAFIGGPWGLHRFYLRGKKDWLAWLLTIPTTLGLYGMERAQRIGFEDPWCWMLIPLLGLTITTSSLTAIIYGLMNCAKWNRDFNPSTPLDNASGDTNWLTIGAVVLALFIGATVLLSSLAYSLHHFFEYQIVAGSKKSL